MANEDDGEQPTPPPGTPVPPAEPPSGAFTGAFPAGGQEPPSGAFTGAFRADGQEDAPPPAGPPSVALTGAFTPVSRDDATIVEQTPSAVVAPTVIEPVPPVRRGTGRVDRGDRGSELEEGARPTGPPPVHDVRPTATAPARPPAPAGGGAGLAILVCVLSLAGIAFLVHRAFPELLGRRVQATAQVTRPGSAEWLDPTGPDGIVVGVRVTGLAGVTRWSLRGKAVDASGTADIGSDGLLALGAGKVAEGIHDVELRIEGKTPSGELALATSRVRLQVDKTAPLLEVDAPASAPPGALSIVTRVRDASPVQLACSVDGRLAWTRGVDPDPKGGPAIVTRPVQLAAGAHTVRLEAMDGAGHLTIAEHQVVVAAAAQPEVPKPEVPKPEVPKPEVPKPEVPKPEVPKPEVPKPLPPTIAATWPPATTLRPGFSVTVRTQGATALALHVDGHEAQALPATGGQVVIERAALGEDGPHRLELVATSPGGSARDSREVLVDGTPPAIEVEVAGDVESARLTGRVVDATDPAPRLSLRVDGAPPVAVTLPMQLALRAGEHAFELTARDAAGNQVQRTLRATVAAGAPKAPLDSVAPAIEVVSPAAASVVREVRVEVRTTDASRVEATLRIDGTEMRADRAEVPGGATFSMGPLRLAEGAHELVVEAEDPRGNRRQTTTSFTLDTVAPDLALVAGARSFTGPVELQARATDATSGLAAIEARLPDGRVVPFVAGAGELLVARFELPEGTHEVTIAARDRAGNETSAARLITVTPAGPPPGAISVRLPARSGPLLRVEGEVPARSQVLVDCAGQRLTATRSLPVDVQLGPGRYLVVVTVTPPGGPPQRFQGQVEIDASPPTIRRLRVTPLSSDRAQVQAEVVDQTALVTVVVLANGAQVATALPCEVPLVLGRNEVVIVARDDVGNESRETRVVDVAPAQPLQPPPPEQPPVAQPERDPREVLAERHLASGRPEDAMPILDEILAETRGARWPLVLRARAHKGLADLLNGRMEKRTHLDQAVSDMNRAIINYGQDVRSEHFRLRGDLYQALSRGRLAEADYEQAERLEAAGR